MFTISLSINPIITHLHPDPPRMDRRPRGKNDRARRERERRKFRKTVFLVSPPPPRAARHLPVLRERAARRREKCNAFMHSDTATAAGEGRRAERRTGGGCARRRSLFCPLPPPSLSFFAAAVQKLAEVFVPAGAPRCGWTDARCVSSWRRRRSSSRAALCPPPDGRRTRPVRPPARSANASLQNSRPTRRPTAPSPPPRVSVRFRRAGPML